MATVCSEAYITPVIYQWRQTLCCTTNTGAFWKLQLSMVPGLRGRGISTSSVARLMQPPQRGTTASSQYKGLVTARVPGKRNQYCEFHKDQHYLFSQVAYRREFSVMFENKCAIFSCGDMNKVKVGALAVSWYHQIHRFFPVEDAPNMPDHDFPVPGYLLIPSGYMKKPSQGGQIMFLEGEDMTEYRDEWLNDTCSMSISTAQYMAGSSRAQPQPQEQESLQQTSPGASLPLTTISTTCITTIGSSTEVSIWVNRRTRSSQTTTLCVEVSEGNSVQHISVSTSASITPGTSQTSTPGTSQSITSSTAPCMIRDSHDWPHFKVPHTGSTTVCLRSTQFHSSTCEMHIHDLKPILEAVVSERKTVVTLIVDGGPDWNTSSLLNALYFMQLWKACNLDTLCVTFAARYSAYNPIKHPWSVLSKKLLPRVIARLPTTSVAFQKTREKRKSLRYLTTPLNRLSMFTGTKLYLMAFPSFLSPSNAVTTLQAITTKFTGSWKLLWRKLVMVPLTQSFWISSSFCLSMLTGTTIKSYFSNVMRVPAVTAQRILWEQQGCFCFWRNERWSYSTPCPVRTTKGTFAHSLRCATRNQNYPIQIYTFPLMTVTFVAAPIAWNLCFCPRLRRKDIFKCTTRRGTSQWSWP